MESNRKDDSRKSSVVNDFLDKFVYSNGFSNVVRESGIERQILGVDVEFDLNGRHYVCDEKAATDAKYINARYPLSTFCLELGSMQGRGSSKIWREGWFTNDNNINDSYLFVWVDEADDVTLSKGMTDIKKCEICLVRKERIFEYLESIGWTKERLRAKEYNIRNNGDRSFGNPDYSDGCKFSFSEFNKGEMPINCLLKRSVYREISDYNKIVEQR